MKGLASPSLCDKRPYSRPELHYSNAGQLDMCCFGITSGGGDVPDIDDRYRDIALGYIDEDGNLL